MDQNNKDSRQALESFLMDLDLEQLKEIKEWAENHTKAQQEKPSWSLSTPLEELAKSAGLDISELLKARKGY